MAQFFRGYVNARIHGLVCMQKILVVSDDVFLRNLVCLSFADMQIEVCAAAGLSEMERLCGRVLFDVIIVLRTSPFLCGCDRVRELRPMGLRRPLLYVVSWQQAEQTVLSLLECGVDQYMTFPVNLQRLRMKVADELNRRL